MRAFSLPTVQFTASSHTQLIDWSKHRVTRPPLVRHLNEEELEGVKSAPLDLPEYPVHAQAVERAVREVTEAAAAVQGEEARHGFVTAALKHRRRMPVFNSKRDFA